MESENEIEPEEEKPECDQGFKRGFKEKPRLYEKVRQVLVYRDDLDDLHDVLLKHAKQYAERRKYLDEDVVGVAIADSFGEYETLEVVARKRGQAIDQLKLFPKGMPIRCCEIEFRDRNAHISVQDEASIGFLHDCRSILERCERHPTIFWRALDIIPTQLFFLAAVALCYSLGNPSIGPALVGVTIAAVGVAMHNWVREESKCVVLLHRNEFLRSSWIHRNLDKISVGLLMLLFGTTIGWYLKSEKTSNGAGAPRRAIEKTTSPNSIEPTGDTETTSVND